MRKVKLVSFIVLLLLMNMSFMPCGKSKINWLTPKELKAAYEKQPKPIMVDVYTDWCGWCKVMDKDTYSNTNVADYINEHYYALKFNAESRDSVEFGSKKYGYSNQNRTNELADYLLFGQMSFPSTVFLSAIDAQPAPIPGYLKPKELEAPLKYFGDGAYGRQNFPEYMKGFKAAW